MSPRTPSPTEGDHRRARVWMALSTLRQGNHSESAPDAKTYPSSSIATPLPPR